MSNTLTITDILSFTMNGNISNETWHDIPGYQGLYQLSSLNRVRSLDRVAIYSDGREHFYKGKIMLISISKDGYSYLQLCKDGKPKTHYLHHLKASIFIPNPNNLPCVGHKDNNKGNNSIDNLYWCTTSQNIKDAWRDGLMIENFTIGENNLNHKLSTKQVESVIQEYSTGNYTQTELANRYGVHQCNISRIVNGIRWEEAINN